MLEENVLTIKDIDILPCERSVDLIDAKQFAKLELTASQKMQINALLGELPSLVAGATLAKAYVARFPDGLTHTLMQLHQGGVSSYYQVDGKFAGTASLYSTSAQAACLSAFTAMSVASGQYFLAEINSKLNVMNLTWTRFWNSYMMISVPSLCLKSASPNLPIKTMGPLWSMTSRE